MDSSYSSHSSDFELLQLSEQIFDLIRDFPESSAKVDELHKLLAATSQYEHVIDSMQYQIESRLLIPGAHTEDILQMYLRTFKVVSLLFRSVPVYSPYKRSEVFLRVTRAVIEHLHKRQDSVKCIVAALLDEDISDDDVSEDNPGDRSKVDRSMFLENENESNISTTPGSEWGLDWNPPPLESAGPAKSAGEDTMSLLIGVYGGKNDFLNEYRDMLASRLISAGSFDVDREIASLELMKTKFEGESLGDCSIMVNDVVESKNLFLKIRNKLGSSGSQPPAKRNRSVNVVSGLVLSKHFWPSLRENESTTSTGPVDVGEQFKFLPKEITAVMKDYEKLYTELKPTQRLQWQKSEGVVSLCIELRNKKMDFRVSPQYVEVIVCFLSDPVNCLFVPGNSALSTPAISASIPPASSLSSEEVASRTKLPIEKVKQIVQFWVTKGVLREFKINSYTINELFRMSYQTTPPVRQSIPSPLSRISESDKSVWRNATPKIVVAGLKRGGKSSILRVLFNKLSPHEASYMEPTSVPTFLPLTGNPLLNVHVAEIPGAWVWDESAEVDELFFTQCQSLILVIDCSSEDIPSTVYSLAKRVVSRALKVRKDIRVHLFLHKIDANYKFDPDSLHAETNKASFVQSIATRMSDEIKQFAIAHSKSVPNSIELIAHCTSIFDNTLHDAFAQVIQLPLLANGKIEQMIDLVLTTCRLEKAVLFDIVSKINLASDGNKQTDISTISLMQDMLEVVIDMYGIYNRGGDTSLSGASNTTCTIRLSNDDVLFLRIIAKNLALVAVIKAENFDKTFLLNHNLTAFSDALQKVVSVMASN